MPRHFHRIPVSCIIYRQSHRLHESVWVRRARFVRNGLEVKMHSLHHQDLVDAMYECAAAAAAAAPGASGKARL